jgi:hypothetical protein
MPVRFQVVPHKLPRLSRTAMLQLIQAHQLRGNLGAQNDVQGQCRVQGLPFMKAMVPWQSSS